MGLLFYTHECSSGSELAKSYVEKAFVIYNPDTGETAFFNVFGDCYSDGNIEPFNEEQMAIVNRRWKEYLECHPQLAQPDPDLFDQEAHMAFMKGL